MSEGQKAAFLHGPDRLELGDGTSLRLLSAMEVLRAQQAGALLQQAAAAPAALCANACILAMAWEGEGGPLHPDGQAVLAHCTISQIQELARRWAQFDRGVNPGLSEREEDIAVLKKVWSTHPGSACNGACSRHFGCCQAKRVRRR